MFDKDGAFSGGEFKSSSKMTSNSHGFTSEEGNSNSEDMVEKELNEFQIPNYKNDGTDL